MKKVFTHVLAAVCMFSAYPSFALVITDMDTPENLAKAIVGSGVTISGISYTGSNLASGYFKGGVAAGIGIESGIVLTSGHAENINGTTNTSDSITTELGLDGYAALDSLIPGYTTCDATILGFDFASVGTSAYFNYVFGSDEYNEYVDSEYNDVFGFCFNGANAALIPGTSTSVAINNVNNGKNSAYYHSNDPSDGTPTPYPFEYDGFTSVFTATLSNLTPGQQYHLDLAIADAGDYIGDSGVFLQGGSFSDAPVDPNPVPEPVTMLLLSTGLAGFLGFTKRKKAQ
jgi:hypothetical protein